jgi:hypothetical protein
MPVMLTVAAGDGLAGMRANAVSGGSAVAPGTRAKRTVWVLGRIEMVLTSDGLNEEELADVCGGSERGGFD